MGGSPSEEVQKVSDCTDGIPVRRSKPAHPVCYLSAAVLQPSVIIQRGLQDTGRTCVTSPRLLGMPRKFRHRKTRVYPSFLSKPGGSLM